MGIFNNFFNKMKEKHEESKAESQKKAAIKDLICSIGDKTFKVDTKNPFYKEYNIDIPRFKLTDCDVYNFVRNEEIERSKFIEHNSCDIFQNSYIVFDMETTGLDPEKNEIIELGAVKFINDIPTEYFLSYINPGVEISKKITDLTGITNEDVKDAPSIDYVLRNFVTFIEDYPLIAHNAAFDSVFFLYNLYKLGYKKPSNGCIDTLALSREYITTLTGKPLKNYKLETLKDELCLFDLSSHNALSDVKVAAIVYQECKDVHKIYANLRNK